jgi:hypothetical protein
MSKFELLTIDEIDTDDKYKDFTVDFVYNYFKKDERAVIINDEFDQNLNGQSLATVSRYVKIDFKRHNEHRGLNALTDHFKELITTSSLESMIEKAVLEENITPNGFFTLKLRDNEDVENFYNLEKSTILSNQQESFLVSATKNRNILEKESNKNTLSEEKYASSIVVDTDFNQPVDKTGHYMNLSNSFMGVFGKTKNLKINTRIKRKYLDAMVKNLSNSPTSPYSNELVDIHQNLAFIKTMSTEDTTDSIFGDEVLYDHDGSLDPMSRVIGYVIEKYEAIVDDESKTTKVQRNSIFVKGTSPGTIIDRNVRYSGTYEYTIKTVVAVGVDTLIEQSETVTKARVLKIFISAGSNTRPIFCNERIPPKPPESLFFQYNFKEDALFINWEFPYNKQQDVKRFQIYRRSTLSEPFSLLREYNFDDSTITDNYSPSSGNSSNVKKLLYPKCSFFDYEFKETSKYVYAVAAIDARGLSSGYSDQFMVSYDRFTNTTNARFISRSGAPKPYPNIFLEVDALPDVINTQNTDKIKVFFTPECKKIQSFVEGELVLGDTFIDKDIGNYRIQLINTETQESANVVFSIDEEEFLTEDEILRDKFASSNAGF